MAARFYAEFDGQRRKRVIVKVLGVERNEPSWRAWRSSLAVQISTPRAAERG